MKILLGLALGAALFVAAAVSVEAKPLVKLSGSYVASTHSAHYLVDGSRAGRDLSLRQKCSDGVETLQPLTWLSSKSATATLPFSGTWCSAAVWDMANPAVPTYASNVIFVNAK